MEVQNSKPEKSVHGNSGSFPGERGLPQAVHELEKKMIEEAMVRSGGNQRLASEILGITERMLGYRLKQYGLKPFIERVVF